MGLRPRLLAALLFTSAVTLAVAALALLSPLEHRLRTDGESTVVQAIASTRAEFAEVGVDPKTSRPDAARLAATAGVLRHRGGGQVTVLDERLEVVYAGSSESLDVPDYFGQVRRALLTGRSNRTLVGDELVAVLPIQIGRDRYAVVLVKRLAYVSSATQVVQSAFLKAALAGLGIALVLGIAFSTTLLRRLERLREAARELESRGLEAPMPQDSGRDEIGDLARSFAGMQSRLQRQEASRRAFVATASHELRTPLASMTGMLELLGDDLSAGRLDLEQAREHAERAHEQSRRLSRLASDLLDLSRLDADVPLRSEAVELGEICRAVAAEFEQRAHTQDVRLRIEQPAGSSWASADPGALARIVRILLDNALRVAPPGSPIEMRIAREGRRAAIAVSDLGPGVPAQERELIFERFQRGSGTDRHSGFGLGLAIGRELARRMSGSLELHEQSGPGACFELVLPATDIGEDTGG
jgi:signal transduction histidine kinase